MDESTQRSPPNALTFALTAVGTVLVMMVLVAGLAVLWATMRAADAKRGWTLGPVVRAARDLKPGMVLTRADVEPGVLPDQFATASLVRPAELGDVLGRPLTLPLQRGDALWHAHVARRPPLAACAALVKAAAGPDALSAPVLGLLAAVEAEVKARQAPAPEGR